jgi:hypothetical protein
MSQIVKLRYKVPQYNRNLDIKEVFVSWIKDMWCDYLRCLDFFLKIKVDLCFKFDLREALDIRDFLKKNHGRP